MSNRAAKEVSITGLDLIREPLLNKGSAFTAEERKAFGLQGLLPVATQTMELQAERMYEALSRFDDPLEKYVALAALQDRNEHLYFYLLRTHLEEMLPIVYTPTVGLATRRFSHVFQRGRGVWISPEMRGNVAPVLRRGARDRDIRLIVVTDNESILGIGDQGAGGIAISIGKLALYTAGAGIDPSSVLPVSLDVGTENQELLSDPMYVGRRAHRLRGADYEELLDEFVAAVKSEFPGALVQWEDFRKDNALLVMDRYRETVLSFNDDIQGTGAVALAGLLSAARVHGRPLAEERIVIVGAGAAGLGIYRQIRAAMVAASMADAQIRRALAAVDSRGLIVDDGSIGDAYKREMAWTPEDAQRIDLDDDDRSFAALCTRYRPTVLIGTSGQRGIFSERIIRAVAEHTDRPVILPMSNPTDLSEAEPADIYAWTNGRALVAAGSPFPDVAVNDDTKEIGQANNAFIFPGVGQGALLSGTARVTDDMFCAAAQALADAVTDDELAAGLLYPPVARLHDVSLDVARAVMRCANPDTKQAIDAALDAHTWSPEYRTYRLAE